MYKVTAEATIARLDRLNELTAKVTAFKSFAELAARMLDGYVPTLRDEADSRELAILITKSGFRAWNPTTGQNWKEPG